MNHLSLDDLGDVETVTGHPHLAECAQCSGALHDQRAVRDLLASLAGPLTAPPDVVTAVDAALLEAAASGSTAGAPDPGPAPLLGPRTPLREVGRPPSRRRRVAIRAAQLLVGLAAAGLVVTGLGHLPRGGSDSAAGTASTSGSASAGGTASTSGGASADSATPGAQRLDGSGSPTATELRTGTRYTRAGLVQQARRLVVTPTGGYLTGGRVAAPVAASSVGGCLRAAAVTGAVQAVDDAAYEGRPATIVVLLVGSERQVVVLPRVCARQPGLVLATATLR